MNKLQQKLKENKNRIRREKFLSALDSKFSDFLSNAEFSGDAACLKYAAFPALGNKDNVQTTIRGDADDWKNFSFKTWQELISVLKKFKQIKNFIGWFFEDIDGPYYKISLNAFFANIESISNYGISHEHYDFGWVGAVDDVGIIIRYNHESSTPNKFEVILWGL